MDMPNVQNVLIDSKRGVRYEVVAYRRLSEQELVMCVRMYLGQKKVKKPKKGDIITITTIIGHND